MTTEIWRPIAGWEKSYEVSNRGRVRSLNRLDNLGRRVRGQILKYAPRPDGAVKVHLCRCAKYTARLVSHLVAAAFLGPRPPGHVLGHLNGNPSDNDVRNLAWRTPRKIALTRKGGPERDDDGFIRPTRLVATDEKTGETLRFRSVGAAARAGFSRSGIANCLRGHCNTHAGFRWAIDTAYQKDANHANHS